MRINKHDTDGVIAFTVNAVPIAQPRQKHRVVATGLGNRVHNYTPARAPVNVFKACISHQASIAMINRVVLDGPISLLLTIVLPRPKGLIWKTRPMPRLPHFHKPDLDNLYKAITDAMNGIVYRDDSQICQVNVKKFIAAGDESPSVLVVVEEF